MTSKHCLHPITLQELIIQMSQERKLCDQRCGYIRDTSVWFAWHTNTHTPITITKYRTLLSKTGELIKTMRVSLHCEWPTLLTYSWWAKISLNSNSLKSVQLVTWSWHINTLNYQIANMLKCQKLSRKVSTVVSWLDLVSDSKSIY